MRCERETEIGGKDDERGTSTPSLAPSCNSPRSTIVIPVELMGVILMKGRGLKLFIGIGKAMVSRRQTRKGDATDTNTGLARVLAYLHGPALSTNGVPEADPDSQRQCLARTRDSHVSSSALCLTFMAQLDYQKRYQRLAHKSGINAVALSPDGRRFVTGSNDSTVLVWSTGSAGDLCQIKAHSPVLSLAWLTNANGFIFGCKNGMLASVDVLEVCLNLHMKIRCLC